MTLRFDPQKGKMKIHENRAERTCGKTILGQVSNATLNWVVVSNIFMFTPTWGKNPV